MPELPEVQRTCLSLTTALVGARIISVRVHRPEVVAGSTRKRDLLVGAEGISLHRHGKQFALEAGDGRVLLAHLGMTGGLCVEARSADLPAHSHVVWNLRFEDGRSAIMRFTDPRRFGGLWTFPDLRTLRLARWDDLGPDALTIRPEALSRSLRASRRAIKACLLDQRTLAGVGNIYADECLFLAGVHPSTEARDLSDAEIREITKRLKQVLRKAIQSGGSTLRDYRDASGQAGEYQRQHKVYGRGGEPCVACETTLETAQIGQRTTVWCPRCQDA